MKRKLKVSRRCSAKVQILVIVLSIFLFIHFRYVFNVDHDFLERAYTMPDNIMKFPSQRNVTMPVIAEKSPSKSNKDGTPTCQPKRGVVFLKTHKTGSTTMTNIFLRYAEKHKLGVGLPPPRKWELAGYPAFFNKRLVDPQLKQYEMLCHHFRMDMRVISQIVPADTVYVTILREPANAFESGFSFFRDGPFSTWMPDYVNENALEKFLNAADKYYNKSTPWYFRAKNYQSFDLGFEQDREDGEYIESALYKMDNWFDLIMITERFEESLILLKDLLCMESLEDVLHIRLKVRQNSLRRTATEEMREKMRQWNNLDTKIYEYFLDRLERKITNYGKEKMASEVETLQNLLDATEKECVLEYDHEDLRPWISRIRLNKDSGDLCKKLSWGEVKFGDYMRSYQRKYLQIQVQDQLPPEELKRLLEAEQKRVLHL